MKNKAPFLNSDYIVIEYMDLIKNPMYVLLHQIQKAIQRDKEFKLSELLNVKAIESLSEEGLVEWYVYRNNFNFFRDLKRNDIELKDDSWWDELLNDQLSLSPLFYTTARPLPMIDAIKVMKNKNIVKDVIIYYPFDNDYAKKDLDNLVGHEMTFMKNFDEIIDITKSDSTYFFADARLIFKLKEKGYLKYSSVTIPVEYSYNKKDKNTFIFDYDELYITDIFKLSYMNALTFTP